MDELAVFVHHERVTGEVPAVAHVVVPSRIVEIPAPGRALHREPTDATRGQRLQPVVDHTREATALQDMARFVDAGITTFDGADIYTGVESLIGRFLAGWGSGATRVQVHTKRVPDLSALPSYSRDDVPRVPW